MSGSNKNDISWSELMKFAAGTADDETHARVSQALDDKDHPVSYLMRRKHGLNNASPTVDTESTHSDDERDVEKAIAESAYSEISEYLAWEQQKLEEAMLAELPEDLRPDSELVYRSDSSLPWSVLQPYLSRLREIVRDDWNWPQRDSDHEFKNENDAASALSQFLVQYQTELPFDPPKLAVALVRLGLSRICGT